MVELFLLVLASCFVVVVCVYPDRFLRDDYQIYWLPIIGWVSSSLLTRFPTEAAMRAGELGKGAFNMLVVEPALVGCVASFYAIRFFSSTLRKSELGRQVFRVILTLVCAAIPWLVPGLPD